MLAQKLFSLLQCPILGGMGNARCLAINGPDHDKFLDHTLFPGPPRFLGHLVLQIAVYRLAGAASELQHIPENRIILWDEEAFCALGIMLR
jgi:hypothetical protein